MGAEDRFGIDQKESYARVQADQLCGTVELCNSVLEIKWRASENRAEFKYGVTYM